MIVSDAEFRTGLDVVADRENDPGAFATLMENAEWKDAWTRWESLMKSVGSAWNYSLRHIKAEDWKKQSPGRSLRRYTARPGWKLNIGGRSRDMAIVLGEVKRVAAGGQVGADAELVAKAQEEGYVVGLYPLLAAVGGMLLQRKNPGYEIGTDIVLEAVEWLDGIQAMIGTGPLASACIGRNTVPLWTGHLSNSGYLSAADLADCFQKGYDERWHTKPKTKTARGSFVEGIRERAIVEGSAGLLTVLAAGSDGSIRAVAGGSARTPEKVYERMIYDNAFVVLKAVVTNPRFDDRKAYAMIEKDLPMQLASVMLHGNVNMGIRVLACRKAIANPGVDPYKIYKFLVENRRNVDVPEALWKDFVQTLQGRLKILTDAGNLEAAKRVEERLGRVTSDFVVNILKPYAEAVSAIGQLEQKIADAKANNLYRRYYDERLVDEHKKFVTGNEFLKDPAVMDLFLSGARDTKTLITILEAVRAARLPVSKGMIVRIMTSSDVTVRAVGLKMVPKCSDEEAARMAQELDEQIRTEYKQLDAAVRSVIIPDYEDIDAEARSVSRMHYHFMSAKVLSDEQLINAFVEAARVDPTKIPDEFRKKTEEALALRQGQSDAPAVVM